MMIRNFRPRGAARIFLFGCMLGVSGVLFAQQPAQPAPQAAQSTPAPPSTPPATPQAPTTPSTDPGAASPTLAQPASPQNDRILWTLPNYMTVENATSMPPIGPKEKFKLVAEGTFDPIQIAFIGGEALVYQAANTNPTFRQGLKGYGKRYALAFSDNAIENFMVSAVLASAFRQDPRYYQSGKGSVIHRFGYAAVRIVVIRGDSGKNEFNISEILGAGMAAGISNAYHPGPQNLGTAVNTWATQIGWDAVGYEMREFWPDLRRYMMRGKHHNN